MIEIIQILSFFIIFTSSLLVPINIFSKYNNLKNLDVLDKGSFNLAINLNILLFVSFLKFPLDTIKPILLIIYLLMLIYNYFFKLKELKDFLFSILSFFIIFTILSINIASELYLGWDAKFFYYIKSLFFFENLTIYNLNQFSENIWHPYLGSYLWGFFWSMSPLETEYIGRLFYLFIFSFSFFYITKVSTNNILNIFLFIFLTVIFYEYKFFSGLQEILLFSFLVFLGKYFNKINEKNFLPVIIAIILFANLFLWIKSEGIVYFTITMLSIILFSSTKIRNKVLITLSFSLLFLLKYYIYQVADIDINTQKTFYNYNYISSLNLEIILYKIMNITIWLIYYILTNIFFLIFVLLILFETLIVKKKIILNFNQKVLYFYLIAILTFIYFAYISRDMEIVYSIRTTMDRLVMTASGFFIYTSLVRISDYLKIYNIKKLLK